MARKRQARKCSAHRTSGEPCAAYAMAGGTVCAAHGGRAGQVKAAAERRVAEQAAMAAWARYAPPGSEHPVNVWAELERVLGRLTAFADFATARIEALTAEEWAAFSPRTAAEVDLFRQALRDAGRLLTEVARLGLDERTAERAAHAYWRAVAGEATVRIERILTRLGHPDPRRDPAVAAVVAAEFMAPGWPAP